MARFWLWCAIIDGEMAERFKARAWKACWG